MNMKRILVLVMTFAMLLGAFAPALGVFAGNHKETTTNEKLNYVSIGDSMANGYGFEGYEQGKTVEGDYMTYDKFIAGDGVYGEGSYALQFADYLTGLGYDVNHTKLAVSALRAEDLLYLLGGMDQPTDDWFEEVVYYSTGAKDFSVVPQLATHYQNAVKNADVITLGIGNASFGAFMLSRVTSALGVMGGSLDDEQLEMYTLENALDLLEDEAAKEKVLEIYNKLFDELNKYVDENTAATYKLETVCEIVAYIGARFLTSYAKSIDKIVELNQSENLEIMLVGLMNTTYGMTITLDDGTPIYFGDIMDEVFGLLNAYIAAYPTAQQAVGNYKGVTFYYAENTQPDFIVNSLDDLKNAGWTNVDFDDKGNGRLSADIVRSRTITTFNGALAPMISLGFVAGINAVIEGQVKAGVDAAFPTEYAKGVEAGVLAYFREEFGVDSSVMDDVAFKQYIYDAGYGPTFEGAYDSAYAENYDTEYNKALDKALEENLLPYDYALLPEITLDDVKAYETNTPAAWNNEYFFMNDTDRKNLAIAVYLGVEEAIVNSVELTEIPLGGLTTIVGDLMSVFDGFAPSIASPEAVHADIATFFSNEDMLPLIKIFAIFKIGDGMCVHSTPTGHDDTYNAIVKSYEENWTAQEQTIQNIMDAYFNAYQFADEQGVFDTASSAIETAIDAIYVAIEEVKGFDGISDELKDRLVKELYATIDTLEELKSALDLDKAETLDGLVGVIVDLKDDLITHLENIYAILEQAGIEYGPVVLEYIETVVIPVVLEAVETFVNDVVAFVQEKVEYYFGVAYDYLVEVLVRVQLYVQEKLDNAIRPIINAYYKLYDKLVEIYGTIEEAIKFANLIFEQIVEFNDMLNGALAYATEQIVDLFITLYEVYGSVEKALFALNDILMNVVETAGQVIEDAIAIYNTVLEILVNTYGAVENAVIVASQIFALIYDFVGEDLKTMLDDIVAIVTDVYGTTKDAYYVASQVYAYLVEVFDYTFDGKYVVDEDSAYVALGYPLYCDELAEMLQLADKHYEFGLDEDYIDAIAGADLITVKFDNGEVLGFVFGQLSEPTPIDWSNILDAEGQKALEELLASIKVELVVSGKAESLSHVVSDLVGDEEVNLTPEDVAEAITFAIESAIYCYADFVIRVTTTLENVYTYAPEALVVITGIDNPALLLEFLGIELGEYAQMLDAVVSIINAHFALMTSTNENTVFVNSNDAQDIYDALNVEFNFVEEPVCPHAYDDCEDTTCNLCGEERVAPGHSFTNYTYNNDATCGVNGTETAKCDNCDAENTREAQGTALQHNWAEATCTAPKTCTLCGVTEGEMLPHTYGPWNVLREPTHKVQGFQERKCTVCGRLDTAVIPCLEGMSTGAIIAIVVGSVVVLGGVGTVVYFQIKKKKVAASANAKTED